MTRTANRKISTTAGAIAVAAVAATMLAGCTHGSTPKSAAKSDAPAVSTVPKADNIANDPKARPSVSMKDCAATTSGWTAGGTVTNSKDKEATFTIVVSFTSKQSTVLARGETKVTVKPGATKKWTSDANFAKTKGVQCVLRGVSES